MTVIIIMLMIILNDDNTDRYSDGDNGDDDGNIDKNNDNNNLLLVSGQYYYMEATDVQPGTSHRMYTPWFDPDKGPYQLSFWYHMQGTDVGDLKVYPLLANGSIGEAVVHMPAGEYIG